MFCTRLYRLFATILRYLDLVYGVYPAYTTTTETRRPHTIKIGAAMTVGTGANASIVQQLQIKSKYIFFKQIHTYLYYKFIK